MSIRPVEQRERKTYAEFGLGMESHFFFFGDLFIVFVAQKGHWKQEESAPTAQGGRLLSHTAFVSLHGKLVLTQEIFYGIRSHHVLSLEVKYRITTKGHVFTHQSFDKSKVILVRDG
jgi:hypothetical protein